MSDIPLISFVAFACFAIGVLIGLLLATRRQR